MIFWMVILIANIFFIENRLRRGKQIHIHYLCIILFSLLSIKILNTLLCITLIYWLVRSMRAKRYFSLKPYILPLVILSTFLLFTGVLSIYTLNTVRSDLLGLIVRNFVIMTVWPIMIAYTIPNILVLKKVAYFYAVLRIIEVSISGMIIYFFYYQQFYMLITLSNLDISISDYNYPRLLSVGAPNSNDAAFVLLGALGLIVYKLFSNFKRIDFILSVTAFFGILFTWSRSVWIFLFLYFVLIIGNNSKLNKSTIFIAGILLLVLTTIGIQLFEERKANDDRLQTQDNASSRKHQMVDYITAIPNLPFFWGTYDDPRIIAKRLNLRGAFSSENYTLEIFTRNGILAGCFFLTFFFYFITSYWQTTKYYIELNKQNKNNTAFVFAMFATYISLFLMAQSSLFRNNLILWIMIGFMSVIKQQKLVDNHEE